MGGGSLPSWREQCIRTLSLPTPVSNAEVSKTTVWFNNLPEWLINLTESSWLWYIIVKVNIKINEGAQANSNAWAFSCQYSVFFWWRCRLPPVMCDKMNGVVQPGSLLEPLCQDINRKWMMQTLLNIHVAGFRPQFLWKSFDSISAKASKSLCLYLAWSQVPK